VRRFYRIDALGVERFGTADLDGDQKSHKSGEDIKFIDPDGEFVGWQALNERAQVLLNEAPDSVFEEEGPRYVSTDTAALAWRFGPPGGPRPAGSTSSRCVTAA
jgi:hypothetical protein